MPEHIVMTVPTGKQYAFLISGWLPQAANPVAKHAIASADKL